MDNWQTTIKNTFEQFGLLPIPITEFSANNFDCDPDSQLIYGQRTNIRQYRDISSGKMYAIKCSISDALPISIKLLAVESVILQELNERISRVPLCPYIVPLLGTTMINNSPALIIPWYPKTLYEAVRETGSNLIRKQRTSLTPLRVFELIKQIAEGVRYMHTHNVIHRNLCAKNIYVQYDVTDDTYHATISGFGSAAMEMSQNNFQPCLPTLLETRESVTKDGYSISFGYLPPELLHKPKKNSSYQTDIWSFGVLIWQVYMYGAIPFSEFNVTSLYAHLKAGHRLKPEVDWPPKLVYFLRKCWCEDMDLRPSFIVGDVDHYLSDMTPDMEQYSKKLMNMYFNSPKLTSIEPKNIEPKSIELINNKDNTCALL